MTQPTFSQEGMLYFQTNGQLTYQLILSVYGKNKTNYLSPIRFSKTIRKNHTNDSGFIREKRCIVTSGYKYIIITHPQAYCIILTYPAKEKSRFIIVCLNTCLTVTYITHNKLVYFWCTLFSFNSEVLYNFAGVKTNHRTSMLNFIKFLLLLFVLASSAQKGYC